MNRGLFVPLRKDMGLASSAHLSLPHLMQGGSHRAASFPPIKLALTPPCLRRASTHSETTAYLPLPAPACLEKLPQAEGWWHLGKPGPVRFTGSSFQGLGYPPSRAGGHLPNRPAELHDSASDAGRAAARTSGVLPMFP